MGIGHVHVFQKTNEEKEKKMPTKKIKHTDTQLKQNIVDASVSPLLLFFVLFRLNKTISEQFLISKQIFNYRNNKNKDIEF